MLSLLKLPEQQNRDAVLILHMGGTFGDKAATLDRFRENYTRLSPSIKMRLVLENDHVSWSVHDLLPICEELNIPLCLDVHHHNIIFDSSQIREGTLDTIELFPKIKATWDRKGIRQKMHYSEACPEAITGRQRRKHNPRPVTLPPCPNDMDLMIEAKDKEQSVFELMRTFKLPGWDSFNNMIPYERTDDNKPLPKKRKKTKKQIGAEIEEFGKELSEEEEEMKEVVPDEEIGMGGKENRVYWPQGMEEWLRPKKREIKKKGENEAEIFNNPTPVNFVTRKAITARNNRPFRNEVREKLREVTCIIDVKKILDELKEEAAEAEGEGQDEGKTSSKKAKVPTKKQTVGKRTTPAKKSSKILSTPGIGALEEDNTDGDEDLSLPDLSVAASKAPLKKSLPRRESRRANAKKAETNSASEEE
jgi:UV DNA damage endonuclease